MDNIFYEYWRECLRSHLKHVVETKDIVNELTLLTVLRDTGYTADEIEEMRVQFGGLATPKPEIAEVPEEMSEEVVENTSTSEGQPVEEFAAGEDEFFNPNAALAQPPPVPAERMDHFIEPVLESPVISDLPDSATSNESTESVEYVIQLERDQFDDSVVQFTPDFSVMEAPPEVQAVIHDTAVEMPLEMPLEAATVPAEPVEAIGSVAPDPDPVVPAAPEAPKPPKPPKEKPKQMSLF